MKRILIFALALYFSILSSSNSKIENVDNKQENVSGVLSKYLPKELGNLTSQYLDNFILYSNLYNNDIPTSQLKKYLYDGQLDKSFGNNGIAQTPFAKIYSIAMDPITEKIFVLGYASESLGLGKTLFGAFTKDGILDKSFAEGKGFILLDDRIVGYNENKLAIQQNGKILLLYINNHNRKILKYAKDGSLEDTFEITTAPSTFYPSHDEKIIYGKIIFGTRSGWDHDAERVLPSYLARLLNDGQIDELFGENGYIEDLKNGRAVFAISEQKDGKIISSNINEHDGNSYISRHLPNGDIDHSFGNEKIKNGHSNIGKILPSILEIDNEGRILVAGFTWNEPHAKNPTIIPTLQITRLLANGLIDKEFAKNGLFEKTFTHEDPTRFANIILLKALYGSITVGGDINGNNFLLRLNDDGTEDITFKKP